MQGIVNVTAQKGLAISEMFDGNKPCYAEATKVWVEGSELKPYKLTLYKSITVKNNPEAYAEMEAAVLDDCREALNKELGHIGGHLYYAFICLPSRKSDHYRYLFYRNASLRTGGRDEATIVYMEGSTTMEGLKQLFKKKQ